MGGTAFSGHFRGLPRMGIVSQSHFSFSKMWAAGAKPSLSSTGAQMGTFLRSCLAEQCRSGGQESSFLPGGWWQGHWGFPHLGECLKHRLGLSE